jgi:hypothetical protein
MLVQQFYQSPAPFCPPAVIPGNPPVNAGGADAPDVTGTLNVGDELHCDPGFWTGDATISYAYQWFQVGAPEPPGAVLTTDGVPLTVDGEELTS